MGTLENDGLGHLSFVIVRFVCGPVQVHDLETHPRGRVILQRLPLESFLAHGEGGFDLRICLQYLLPVNRLLEMMHIDPDRVAVNVGPNEIKDKLQCLFKFRLVLGTQVADVRPLLRETIRIDVDASKSFGVFDIHPLRLGINQSQVMWIISLPHALQALFNGAK